jgi:hypothetical protein
MRTCSALLFGVLMCIPRTTHANAPPPPPVNRAPRISEAPVAVVPGKPDDPQMYIRLPSSLWRNLRADAASDGSTRWYAFASSHRSTLFAGAALTSAVSLAGLWVVRGGRRRKIGGGIFLLIAVGLVGISGCPWISPDSPFTFYDEQLSAPVVQDDGCLKGEALLDCESDRSAIEIVVPPKELVSFTQTRSGR